MEDAGTVVPTHLSIYLLGAVDDPLEGITAWPAGVPPQLSELPACPRTSSQAPTARGAVVIVPQGDQATIAQNEARISVYSAQCSPSALPFFPVAPEAGLNCCGCENQGIGGRVVVHRKSTLLVLIPVQTKKGLLSEGHGFYIQSTVSFILLSRLYNLFSKHNFFYFIKLI